MSCISLKRVVPSVTFGMLYSLLLSTNAPAQQHPERILRAPGGARSVHKSTVAPFRSLLRTDGLSGPIERDRRIDPDSLAQIRDVLTR